MRLCLRSRQSGFGVTIRRRYRYCALSVIGVPLKHETIGEAGTVSWIHAAPYKEELRELEKWFSDEKSVELRSSTDFQSFPVVSFARARTLVDNLAYVRPLHERAHGMVWRRLSQGGHRPIPQA